MTDDASCPLCGGKTQGFLQGRPDYEYGNPTRLRYHRCCSASCGLIFASPIPVDQIPGFYIDYSTHSPPEETDSSGIRAKLSRLLTPATIRREFGNYLGDWIAENRELSILDFGCGNARLLKRLKSRGFRNLIGFDFDPKARSAAYGQELVIYDEPEELFSRTAPFDIIVLNHVVEHLDDPADTIRQLLRLLAPGGIMYLRTPNSSSALSALFGENWRGYETPRHLHLFNSRNVRSFVARLPQVSATAWTENGLFQGMYHESFVGPFWKSKAGRVFRHALFPLAAWACVGINRVWKDRGEELVVMLRREAPAAGIDTQPPRP